MLSSVKIDTLHLVSKLTREQKDELHDLIDFRRDYGEDIKIYWNGNAVYQYIMHSKNPFFMIFFESKIGTGLWTKSHYDILVLLQQEAIQIKPKLLKMILGIGEWRVKRIDIAFDWLIPINNHFIWKNVNIKRESFLGNQNYYLYGERSENRAIIYDKKLQLKTKKNIEIPVEHLTRLEIRIRPKLKNQSANATNLEWLKKHLDKFTFVENAMKLSRSLKGQDAKAFRALRRNASMNWEAYGGDSVKRRIRKKAKEQSVNLYELFTINYLEKNII